MKKKLLIKCLKYTYEMNNNYISYFKYTNFIIIHKLKSSVKID